MKFDHSKEDIFIKLPQFTFSTSKDKTQTMT